MIARYRRVFGAVAVVCLVSCAPAEDEAVPDQRSDTTQMIDTAQVVGTPTDSPAAASPDPIPVPTVRDSAAAATRPPTKQRPPIIGRDSVIQPILVPDSSGRLVPRDTL